MTNKELFIKEVENFIELKQMSKEAIEYFENNIKKRVSKEGLTENGKRILIYMQENSKNNTVFSAKMLGEGLSLSSRSVSGSMRKLVTDKYVEKITGNPTGYQLTTLGKDYKVD